jgi:hypothetical protein
LGQKQPGRLCDAAANAREATGDLSGAASDRGYARGDRDANDIDTFWAGRDADNAAGDRALLMDLAHADADGSARQHRDTDSQARNIARHNRNTATDDRQAAQRAREDADA